MSEKRKKKEWTDRERMALLQTYCGDNQDCIISLCEGDTLASACDRELDRRHRKQLREARRRKHALS